MTWDLRFVNRSRRLETQSGGTTTRWTIMNPRPGVLLKVFAASGATNMAACINGLERQIPTGEVVFFRSVAALAPFEIWLGLQGGLIELTSAKHFGGNIVRSISGTGGMFFSYVALAYLPLADATSISYAAPLFTVIPAAIVLGEVVRSYHWTAVVVSCCRAGHALTASCFVCIRWGEFRRHHGILGAAFGLAAAFCSALSSVQIRHLAKTEKPSAGSG
jgi:drug/metabolite transporter (DMT)-like permease